MRVACNQVGGPSECAFTAQGDSPDELANQLADHATIHPNVKEQMDSMTDEDRANWMEMMKGKIQH